MNALPPNIPTPKRPGDTLDASSNKEARASNDVEEATLDVNLKDFGQPNWEGTHFRSDANQVGRERAIHSPLLGWPDFARLFAGDAGYFIYNPSATRVRRQRMSA